MNPTIIRPLFALSLAFLPACADDLDAARTTRGALESVDDETIVRDEALIDLRTYEDSTASGGASIDMWTSSVGSIEVHAVADEIGEGSAITQVRARYQPDTGYEQRLRFRAAGGEWSAWGTWTTSRVERRMNVPAPGGETREDFEVEMRESASTPTIAVHGYIRIKKLNSGG